MNPPPHTWMRRPRIKACRSIREKRGGFQWKEDTMKKTILQCNSEPSCHSYFRMKNGDIEAMALGSEKYLKKKAAIREDTRTKRCRPLCSEWSYKMAWAKELIPTVDWATISLELRSASNAQLSWWSGVSEKQGEPRAAASSATPFLTKLPMRLAIWKRKAQKN